MTNAPQDEADILASQIRYYRNRAPEYDDWVLRRGSYDRGEKHRQQWFAELSEVENALLTMAPIGDALEIACGTGQWTRHLAPVCQSLMAVDTSPEVIAINRETVASPHAKYLEENIFDWEPTQQFDFILFGFWLSHVPSDRFNEFWDKIARTLKPNGTVFFVDSKFSQNSKSTDAPSVVRDDVIHRRVTENGDGFDIFKVFYEPVDLESRLLSLGWSGKVNASPEFFIYGSMHRGV